MRRERAMGRGSRARGMRGQAMSMRSWARGGKGREMDMWRQAWGSKGRETDMWKQATGRGSRETDMQKRATASEGRVYRVRSRSAGIARPFTFRCWLMLRPSISGYSGRCFFMAGTKKVWRPRVVKTWLMSAGCCGNVCSLFEKTLGEYRTVYAKRGCRGLCARIGNA